jgi:uncharacterized damage-inducible protein DinB
MSILHRLTQYKAWANRLFFETLATMPEQTLTKPQKIGFGSMLRTLHHAYAMDRVWQCHMIGQAHGYTTRNPEHCPSFDELRLLQSEMDAWYVAYSASLSEANSNDAVPFSFIGGGEGKLTRADMILHAVNHTTYHRGHVATMMYEEGVFPPTTDLPVFLRERAQRI